MGSLVVALAAVGTVDVEAVTPSTGGGMDGGDTADDVSVDPPDGFADVQAGHGHSCGLTHGRRVQCWGWNWAGQLGDGSTVNSRNQPSSVVFANDQLVADIATGEAFSCAAAVPHFTAQQPRQIGSLSAAGFPSAYCWGDNADGQLGDGTTQNSNLPRSVLGLGTQDTVVQVAAGGSHACAVTASGLAYCWGDNGSGQLGDGTTIDRHRATPVAGLTDVREIAAGSDHTCAVTHADRAYCWGDNSDGQLGDTTRTARITPTPVAGGWMLPVTHIAAGDDRSCASTPDRAYCWGDGSSGALGAGGGSADALAPREVARIAAPTAISVGGDHTCAISGVGGGFLGAGVYCWGTNWYGQVGDGTEEDRGEPVYVLGLDATSVTAGGDHTCATTTSVAYCWGSNFSGELGDGSNVGWQLTPTQVREGPPPGAPFPPELLSPPDGHNWKPTGSVQAFAVRGQDPDEDGLVHRITVVDRDDDTIVTEFEVSPTPGSTEAIGSPPAPLPVGEYAWYARSMDPGGTGIYGPPSEEWRFSVSTQDPQGQAADPAYHYVALGDSYSSGEGLPPYDPATDLPDENECHRSELAFPNFVQGGSHRGSLNAAGLPVRQMAQLQPDIYSYDFIACSGAETEHVKSGDPHYWELSQLDQGRLTSATDLVTVTLGANDASWEEVMVDCFFTADCSDPDYRPAYAGGASLDTWVKDKIDASEEGLEDVLQGVRLRSPNATVLMLGYPNLFPDTWFEHHTICDLAWRGFKAEHDWIQQLQDRMEAVQERAAVTAGVPFVSVRPTFDGNEVCGEEGPWIQGWYNAAVTLQPFGSFHPNLLGHKAYAALVNNARLSPVVRSSVTAPIDRPPVPLAPAGGGLGRLEVELLGSPDCEVPAQSVRVFGEGFAPDSAVEVRLVADSVQVAGDEFTAVGDTRDFVTTERADEQGRLNAVASLPLDGLQPWGTIGLRASGENPAADAISLVGGLATTSGTAPCGRDEALG